MTAGALPWGDSPPLRGRVQVPPPVKMAMVPLDVTRYARFHVPRRCSIREYVASLGVKFLPGRSYYELTKVRRAAL